MSFVVALIFVFCSRGRCAKFIFKNHTFAKVVVDRGFQY